MTTAYFPGSIVPWTDKKDDIDYADAADMNQAYAEIRATETTVKSHDSQLAEKANTEYVNSQIQNMSSQVQGFYSTVSDLTTAFPSGNSNNYVVTGNIAEVASLTVSAIPTTAGNVTVTLNGTATTVAVTTDMTTTDLVATAIRGTTFTGWTTGGTGSTVTFTATSGGAKTDATFVDSGSTGITGTMAATTQGIDADNYIYRWNGSAWARTAYLFNSAEIPDGSIPYSKFSNELQDAYGSWKKIDISVIRGYIENNGTVHDMSANATNRYALVNVICGETYKIIGYGVSDLNEIIFKDSNGSIINSIDATSTHDEYYSYTVTVPSTATVMCINSRCGIEILKKISISIQKDDSETVIRRSIDITDEFNFSQDGYYTDELDGLTYHTYNTHKTATITLASGIYKLSLPKVVNQPMGVVVNNSFIFPSTQGNDTDAILTEYLLRLNAETTISVSKVITGINLNTNNYEFKAYKIDEQDISAFAVSTKHEFNNLFVAASNATDKEKDNATYICDGTDDQIEINAAVQAISSIGGKIELSSGIFSISSPIIIDRRLTICGCGASVGSRAEYTPTNGNTFDNTFGEAQYGSTTIRIDADCDGIQVTQFVRGLTLKDFFLQGYGKDRHTHAGINIQNATDVLLIDGINISDCNMCLYAWDCVQDAPNITNSGFEWCGCGMMLNAGYPKMSDVIFCDNNGLEKYNGIDINCGGLVLQSASGVFSNVQIFRSNKYRPSGQNPIHLLYLYHGVANSFSSCHFEESSGCGIYAVNSNCNTINGSQIINVGSANVANNNYGIYADTGSEGWVIMGNNIGLMFGSDEMKNKYHMQEAIKLDCLYGTGHIVIGNRSAYSEATVPFTVAGTNSIVANNLVGVSS